MPFGFISGTLYVYLFSQAALSNRRCFLSVRYVFFFKFQISVQSLSICDAFPIHFRERKLKPRHWKRNAIIVLLDTWMKNDVYSECDVKHIRASTNILEILLNCARQEWVFHSFLFGVKFSFERRLLNFDTQYDAIRFNRLQLCNICMRLSIFQWTSVNPIWLI